MAHDVPSHRTTTPPLPTAKAIVGLMLQIDQMMSFEPDGRGRGWVINPELRRTVVFGRLDLTRDPPISRVDLVTCRNTLMYLNAETQAYVPAVLALAGLSGQPGTVAV